jgi:hypothetical protein
MGRYPPKYKVYESGGIFHVLEEVAAVEGDIMKSNPP